MKTLCLYYTRTNKTKEVMERLAAVLGADLAEYSDGRDRSGIFGYIGACFATVNNTLPRVKLQNGVDLKAYDRVLIGMPVWVEGPCAVGRAFIKKYRAGLPSDVFYVVTHMGDRDYLTKIQAMDDLLGRPSAGQFSVKTKENDYLKESEEYAKNLSLFC